MSDISKEDLKKEVAAILKDADLSSTSAKKVRQEIADKLNIDLSSRRKEIDDLVMEYVEQDKGKNKKNGNVKEEDDDDDEEENEEDEEEDDEEEEEEKKPKRTNSKKAPPAKRTKTASSDESEEASDDEGDDEYSPKKSASKKGGKRGAGASKKKKGGSDDDSDEDWGKGKKKRGGGGGAKKAGGAKRGGGGYTKPVSLSPELAALVGEDTMPRHEVVKRVWAIIKERNLYDPKNKQFAICDDELLKVFGVKRFRTFGMMKFLKNHFRD